jgi:alpha-L-arabinofuranosidase
MSGITRTDMIDPHWYVEPDYFFNNTRIFDDQPRGDYKVYVGEYACNQHVGCGNMLAALSEVAFITGMERNSDLVKMASYAPLFENRNDRTWPVNLIWIDNMQVVGRSSYYVQKVMAENKPTYNLKTDLTLHNGEELNLKAHDQNIDTVQQFSVSGYNETTAEIIIKVLNAEEKPWRASVRINNTGKISSNGEVITLYADSLKMENSFDEPLKISPVKTKYDSFSGEFDYEFKPCSLTVLKIRIEK